MNTIIAAIAVAFSLTILSSCSQDYSSPTSENKSQPGASSTVTSKSETKTETKTETKSETPPAASPEAADVRKTDSLPPTKDTSAAAPSSTASSATNPSAAGSSGSASDSSAKRTSATAEKKKSARSSEQSAALPDRGVTRDQDKASVPSGPVVGVEQITSSRMQTIEGVVLKIDGDSYLVKDLAGNEVKLRADKKTKKDSNLTVGDKILARLEGPDLAAASITKR
jgi:hypothetical protein